MTKDDVKLMVAGTKFTLTCDSIGAYETPDGLCTTSFEHAVRLWCEVLGVK